MTAKNIDAVKTLSTILCLNKYKFVEVLYFSN